MITNNEIMIIILNKIKEELEMELNFKQTIHTVWTDSIMILIEEKYYDSIDTIIRILDSYDFVKYDCYTYNKYRKYYFTFKYGQ